MSQYLEIHPRNPQARLLERAANILRGGGVIAYPTDSTYALGCCIGRKAALDRVRALRRVDDRHEFTLVCADLSQIASYAKLTNSAYRLLKAHTPGPYTFILKGTHEVPRRLLEPKRRTVGIRVPDHPIAHGLLAVLGEPMMSTTLQLPGEALPMMEPWEIQETLEHALDAVIDGGACGIEPTTVVDLVDGVPHVLREGKGDTRVFSA